ncbi:MAG: hypothetical protein ACYDDF_10840 [Thermoplasmatota archaeon]
MLGWTLDVNRLTPRNGETSSQERPEGDLQDTASAAPLPSGSMTDLEQAFHDATNVLGAVRSYAEILRTRSRIGALYTPEPLLEDLVVELERLTKQFRAIRREVLTGPALHFDRTRPRDPS